MAPPGTADAVEVFGEWLPATVAAEALRDPKGEGVRGCPMKSSSSTMRSLRTIT
jgi:hypothetical protein